MILFSHLLLAIPSMRHRKSSLPCVTFLVALLCWSAFDTQSFAITLPAHSMYVRVIDVGAGLCCVAQLPDNHYFIYDAGNYEDQGATAINGIKDEWHCRASKELSGRELRISQFCAEDGSWFLHQLIAVTPAFEHAWFQPARPIGDFAFGNLS